MVRSGESAAALLTESWTTQREIPQGGYAVTRAERVLAWYYDTGLHAFHVLGMSPHALWLEPLRALGLKGAPSMGTGKLWLDAAGERVGPLHVELREAPRPDWIAGPEPYERVAVVRGSLDEMRLLASFIERCEAGGLLVTPTGSVAPPECVSDPALILELLEQFARENVEGFVPTGEGRKATRIRAVNAQEGVITWAGDTASFRLPSCVEFPYLHAVYEVPLAAVNAAGECALPAWITKSVRRTFRRAEAPEGLACAFAHPFAPELFVNEHLRDISRSGFSFEADATRDLLYPGLRIPALKLSAKHGTQGTFSAVVRSVRRVKGQTRAVIGMSMEPLTPADADALRSLVEPALYPSTHTRAADVWALHESSGYFRLSGKTPADFERLRISFFEAAKKLEVAPDVGTVAYWPAQGRVEATVSHFRVYQSSWLACQLSKLKAPDALPGSRAGIRDMYMRIYESAQADSDTRWLLTYVQDAAPRWSREIQVVVAQRFVHTGEGCIVPFRALETDVATPAIQNLRVEHRVELADPITARAAMRDLYRVRPAQYLDALDLTEGRADMAGNIARWHAAGLERERQIFVAYEGTTRVAVAVVELAELGVHIYGLLDCLRMYPLKPGGERAFGALLREAHAFYSQRGRQKFVYLEEFADTLPWRELGFRDLGGAVLSMLSVDRVPELLQRASNLASQRPPPSAKVHALRT